MVTEHLQIAVEHCCAQNIPQKSVFPCGGTEPPVAAVGRQWKMANWFDSRGPGPPTGGGAARNYQLLKIRFAVHYFRIQKSLPFSRPKTKTDFLTQLSGS